MCARQARGLGVSVLGHAARARRRLPLSLANRRLPPLGPLAARRRRSASPSASGWEKSSVHLARLADRPRSSKVHRAAAHPAAAKVGSLPGRR